MTTPRVKFFYSDEDEARISNLENIKKDLTRILVKKYRKRGYTNAEIKRAIYEHPDIERVQEALGRAFMTFIPISGTIYYED